MNFNSSCKVFNWQDAESKNIISWDLLVEYCIWMALPFVQWSLFICNYKNGKSKETWKQKLIIEVNKCI